MSLTAQKYTVLLLSAPLGSGHKMAAEALEEGKRLKNMIT